MVAQLPWVSSCPPHTSHFLIQVLSARVLSDSHPPCYSVLMHWHVRIYLLYPALPCSIYEALSVVFRTLPYFSLPRLAGHFHCYFDVRAFGLHREQLLIWCSCPYPWFPKATSLSFLSSFLAKHTLPHPEALSAAE